MAPGSLRFSRSRSGAETPLKCWEKTNSGGSFSYPSVLLPNQSEQSERRRRETREQKRRVPAQFPPLCFPTSSSQGGEIPTYTWSVAGQRSCADQGIGRVSLMCSST